MSQFARGTQIVYVPTHAENDMEHADCEAGFVWGIAGWVGGAQCRFWSKHNPGELRTKAGSELTPISMLVIKDTVPQARVDAAIRKIEEG